MKLYPKLALMVSALLLLSTLALSLTFYWMEERSLRHQADQERRAVLGNLVHMAEESFLTNDDLLLIKYTGWVQKWNPSIVSASVVDAHGGILAHSEPTQIGKQAPLAPVVAPQTLVLSAPINFGSQGMATASVGFSENVLDEALNAQLRVLQKRALWVGGGTLSAGLPGRLSPGAFLDAPDPHSDRGRVAGGESELSHRFKWPAGTARRAGRLLTDFSFHGGAVEAAGSNERGFRLRRDPRAALAARSH